MPLCSHDFNPRLREGGDSVLIKWFFSIIYFNPRLREGGDRIFIYCMVPFFNFNPRLREGGDGELTAEDQKHMISIHASEKEATSMSAVGATARLFQSTPPRRRRPLFFLDYIACGKFQSTPPRRRRQLAVSVIVGGNIFQSTPPRRRRHRLSLDPLFEVQFQSTPPRRRRRGIGMTKCIDHTFQSTPPRRRRRVSLASVQFLLYISIHASEKEATRTFLQQKE